MDCSTQGLPVLHYQSLLKFMSIESIMPYNHFILCCPFHHLSSNFPRIGGFSNELALYINWPKTCHFSFSISHYNEYSWFISFRMDWFDLPAVQGTLKSLLQHHSSKASILQHSAFLMVHLSYSYMLLLLSRFSRVQLCATPQTAAHQAPPSLGFSRQEHWSGLPFPSPMHESEK